MDRKLNSGDVVDALTDLFILRGPPEYIRSDKGPHTPRASLRDVIVRFRDELLDREIFFSFHEAAPRANDPLDRFLILGSLIEQWRQSRSMAARTTDRPAGSTSTQMQPCSRISSTA
ncbi:MAG: hypothetical protein AAF183_17550 [Pseudomonadota bacterium]